MVKGLFLRFRNAPELLVSSVDLLIGNEKNSLEEATKANNSKTLKGSWNIFSYEILIKSTVMREKRKKSLYEMGKGKKSEKFCFTGVLLLIKLLGFDTSGLR